MKDTKAWTAVSQNEWDDAAESESDGDVLSDKASQLMFMAAPIEAKAQLPMFNVHTRTRPDGSGQYVVALRMSGKSRFIGYKIAESEIACRFADMATLRFRKYIRRVKWNFSEAQAIADTANTEENGGELARMLLDRRANTWKLAGIVLKEVQCAPAKIKSNRRTVESRLAGLESRLGTIGTLVALESRLAALELPIDSRFDLIAACESRLANLEAVVTSLQNELNDALLKIASLQDKVFLLESADRNQPNPIYVSVPLPADAPPLSTPVFYPTITCTDPPEAPAIIKIVPIIWKAPTTIR